MSKESKKKMEKMEVNLINNYQYEVDSNDQTEVELY
jgi:hypothetical protein